MTESLSQTVPDGEGLASDGEGGERDGEGLASDGEGGERDGEGLALDGEGGGEGR